MHAALVGEGRQRDSVPDQPLKKRDSQFFIELQGLVVGRGLELLVISNQDLKMGVGMGLEWGWNGVGMGSRTKGE